MIDETNRIWSINEWDYNERVREDFVTENGDILQSKTTPRDF